MQKLLRRSICGTLLSGILFLSAGCLHQEESTGAGYLFTCTLPGNPECLDPQYTQNVNASAVLPNIMEGLVRFDENGSIVCAEAESYTVSEDGLSYMFNLREDCYWYSTNSDPDRPERVTARDYVYAFRRLLDPATKSPYAEDFLCIKNAAEILDGKLEVKKLGISAPDATTVLFELDQKNPEFLNLLAQSCAVPCNEAFFLTTNGRYGLDLDTFLCNGPFYPAKWVYDQYGGGNFITMYKNPLYYDMDNIYPSSLQFTIMHSQLEAETDFSDGNTDVLMTNTYPKDFIRTKNCTVENVCALTLGLIFNPENELLQNEDLRQALACSIDRTSLAGMLSEDLEVAYGVIPPGVRMLGRSYRELFADEQLAPSYDPVKASRLFGQASAELGLGSMNTIQIMLPSNILDTDALLAVCQEWQNLFGYYIGIQTVSPEEYERRLSAGEYSIALYSIKPERNSCYAALQEFQNCADLLGLESKDFDTMLHSLASADHLADAVSLYGAAEQIIINSNTFIPLFYKNTYLIYTAQNTDIWYDPFSGRVDLRDAKHFS